MTGFNEGWDAGRSHQRWLDGVKAQDIVPKIVNTLMALAVIGASFFVGYEVGQHHKS